MHEKEDGTHDIYTQEAKNIEKDFTPQISKKIIQEQNLHSHQRPMFLISLLLLSIALVAIVSHRFFNEQKTLPSITHEEEMLISRYSLPVSESWVMPYKKVLTSIEIDLDQEPQPISTRSVKDAAYHIVTGQEALLFDDSKKALQHFQTVINIFPEIEGIRRTLGILYLKEKSYEQAAENLEKTLLEKETFLAINNLGNVYIDSKDYDRAEIHLTRALELHPENPVCQKNLAMLYKKMDRDDDAIYHFEKYLALRHDIDTMQTYALYLTEIERWNEAAILLETFTKEVTDVAPMYFLLAQVQIQNGQQQKAILALQQGIQLVDPTQALVWMNYEEFDAIRNSDQFKKLVAQLKMAADS